MMMALLALTAVLSSCDMMHMDRDDCPYGLYIMFRYDYNLQRADMFNDHVGAVTLYVFDEQGRLVKTQSESNNGSNQPLKDVNYRMHVTDLKPGRYQFLALAGQNSYEEQLATSRAKFRRSILSEGDSMTDLEVMLDHVRNSGDEGYAVENNALPLDTLWHGIDTDLVEVSDTRPAYDTISLVRDTKKIRITLRELDDPTLMDISKFDLRIVDHNAHILWDNSLDETDCVTYTPHDTWNSDDRDGAEDSSGLPLDGVGRIGHADFMTSRILYHSDAADDGRLVITLKETGEEVANINLPDMLSRLRASEERYIYTPQGFLDRGYDYQLHFYLVGTELRYVDIQISVLSWSVRVQSEELE